MKALNIIATAYRGTLEEQDDTIVWLSHAMKGAGAEIDVLLRGAAVNYAVKDQHVAPLRFGGRSQAHAPDIAGEIEKLVEKGVTVYIMADDLAQRGMKKARLVAGVEHISAKALPKLFSRYDQIWHW